MKKTLSILVALVLVLCVSAASADIIAHKTNVSEIEGLPEAPSIPTMSTKNDDHTAVITLSEELGWLNVVSNWQWLDIITWDGTTGTYSLDEDAFADLQPGFGGYGGMWGLGPDYNTQDDGEYDTIEDVPEFVKWEKDPWGPRTYLRRFIRQKDNGKYTITTMWYGSYSGNYELGFSYDGETKDGVKVRYDSWGKLVQAIQYVEGLNLFNEEEAPAKTAIIYQAREPLPWIHQVTIGRIESQDADGNVLHYAKFASNGQCISVH